MLLLALAGVVRAEPHPDFRDDDPDRPDGIHVLDGSYVINIGRLHVNVTNHGLIGSRYSALQTYSHAPSAQWPGGTGDEYLYAAGLWVGAKLGGQISVSTGQPEREFRPSGEVNDTIYESRDKRQVRPHYSVEQFGHRPPDVVADDDGDGATDEDWLNGLDDDGDGDVDEDYGQIGDQMLTCTMRDDTRLAREIYGSHRPLGLKVVQRVAGWHEDEYRDVVAIDYEIKNENFNELHDVYLGMYVDCDIQNRSDSATQPDDLTGYYDGVARDEHGEFHRIQVGWMRDAATTDPLPGVFGVMLLDHNTDFSRLSAPNLVGVRTWQRFTTNATSYQGGEPLTDADRYKVMSATRRDTDARPERPDDYRFLMSCGPFPRVLPGRTLHLRVGMLVADGMDELLRMALRTSFLQRGRWFNLDNDYSTGSEGRETKICLGELPKLPDGRDWVWKIRPAFADEACTGPDPVFGYSTVSKDDLFEDEDGRMCVYVNGDNCEECFRVLGRKCIIGDPYTLGTGSTGNYGREHRAAWVADAEVPPPLPYLRIEPRDHAVEVYWDDRSEHEPDYYRNVIDFESYRVWRVTGWQRPEGVGPEQAPPQHKWNMVAEFDIKNFIEPGLAFNIDEQPLGQNTGLEDIVYTPNCLSDPRFAGLGPVMRELVENDLEGEMIELPPVYYSNGAPNPDLVGLQPWAWAPAVLDTFFAVTPRAGVPGVVPKPATRYYRFVDRDVPNGFRTYYSVTARDHNLVQDDGVWKPNGYGVEIPPGTTYDSTYPGFRAQTPEQRAREGANIYVYPNPATKESLAEFDQQFPSLDEPIGSQVAFANLPAAHNTIKIFTASGDLVETIDHDGRDGNGTAFWNLVSRNGQEVVSGIYLYTVEAHDARFERFTGRFVVIR